MKTYLRRKNINLLVIALMYSVAIEGRRINSGRKKMILVNNFYNCNIEIFYKRISYYLDPFYQRYEFKKISFSRIITVCLPKFFY